MVNNSTNINKTNNFVCFVDIGGINDHHCLEVIVCFVDIGGIDDHHCLEVIVGLVDIGGIVDHHCLEVIVCFVDIGGIDDYQQTKQLPLESDGKSIPPKSTKQTITSRQ
jgi:hypothetical protein